MRLIEHYIPPSPDNLNELKEELGFTGNQMAELAGVASNSQWRKYTSGEYPRTMSPHILFYMAAQLALNEKELNRVLDHMLKMGAQVK